MKIKNYAKERASRGESQDPPDETQAWSRRLLMPTGDPQWQLIAAPYTPAQEGVVEAERALGNGSIGMRAVFPFATPGGQPQVDVGGLFGQPPGPVITPVLLTAPLWQETRTMSAVVDRGPGMVLALGNQERSLEAGARWMVIAMGSSPPCQLTVEADL